MQKRLLTAVFVFMSLAFVSGTALAQAEAPLIKGGGYIYLYRFSRYSGFSVNFEYEKTFRKNFAFTRGWRVDYDEAPPFPEKAFPGVRNLVLGYELKFYPQYYRTGKAYNGIFLGAYPCYFVPIDKRFKSGPGIGTMVGYQKVLKKKFSVSLEGCMVYMQNVNEQALDRNSDERYFFFFANIKVGVRPGNSGRMSNE